jgi:NitT/TauT family transport system ATP-binding protein
MDLASPLLRLSAVTKRYPEVEPSFEAVSGVTCEVGSREVFGIVGPSGCGKSTLLRLVAGFIFPSSGEIQFQGHLVTRPGPARAVVFQNYSVFPWLTVRGNVEFSLRCAPGAAQDETDHWLERMQLVDFASRYPKELSGGMRQRLALARALALRPRLLLLDEAFGSLDERTRRSMHRLLGEVLARDDMAVMIVSHDLREVAALAHRVMVLSPRPGKVVDVFVSPRAVKFPNSVDIDDVDALTFHRQLTEAFPE